MNDRNKHPHSVVWSELHRLYLTSDNKLSKNDKKVFSIIKAVIYRPDIIKSYYDDYGEYPEELIYPGIS